MRRLTVLLSFLAVMPVATASAADLPLKAPPMPAAVVYNWTGFYAGGEFGGGWATEQVTVVTNNPNAAFPPGTVFNPVHDNGPLGGAYAGYNYQISQFVVGIDGDYTWANLTGHATDVSIVNADIASESNSIRWIATVTGRVGYAMNNLLIFAKGGGAWAGFNATSVTNTPGGAFVAQTTSSETRNGWTVGGGLEWGFTPHWSAKIEYDYVKFATANFSINEVNAAGVVSSPLRSATSSLNMVKGGIAYRF
jgi:outer membrane immunogenic protein